MHWTITVLLCLQNSLKSQYEKWKGQIKSEKVKSKMWKVKVENWKFIDKSVHWWEESERGNIGQSLISITLLSDDYFITGLGSETLIMSSLICRICKDGATKGEILLFFNIFWTSQMRLIASFQCTCKKCLKKELLLWLELGWSLVSAKIGLHGHFKIWSYTTPLIWVVVIFWWAGFEPAKKSQTL